MATNTTTHYTYDQYNRIQTVQLPEQATLTHAYNPIGQLDNIDYQGQRTVGGLKPSAGYGMTMVHNHSSPT